ncbi:MAG: peptidoglycan-binding protein [Myxococcota bacterium]
MAALARTQQQAPRGRPEGAGPGKQASGAGGRQARFGNEFMKERLGGGSAQDAEGKGGPAESAAAKGGPFAGGWLNGALSAAFGRDIGGLDAGFGETAENDAIGAEAHTKDTKMSFGAGVKEDAADPDAMATIAHETAHALAGGGSGETALDQEGDAGEHAADVAGEAFAAWAKAGFEGPAPKLAPATGGKAAVHRVAKTTLTGNPLVRHGSSGALVRIAQTLLNRHGASLEVDGGFGDKTDNAVRAFQRRRGLEVDGVIGPATAAALNKSAVAETKPATGGGGGDKDDSDYTVTGKPMLRTGSSGALVTALQKLLNAKKAGIDVDGSFGQGTDNAVRGFQTANGLEVDGVVGPATAKLLNSASSKDVAKVRGGGTPFAGNDAYGDMRTSVLAAAKSHLGAPYYWGADGPSMFDCSGFILYVLRQDTGLVSWGDDTAGGIKNRVPSTTSPLKGDLIFYSGSSGVSHIEMYTGSGTTEIGASGGGSSTYGRDPGAKVQYGDMTADGRSRSYGSIAKIIAAKKK